MDKMKPIWFLKSDWNEDGYQYNLRGDSRKKCFRTAECLTRVICKFQTLIYQIFSEWPVFMYLVLKNDNVKNYIQIEVFFRS